MREVHADLLQGEARPKFKERRHEVHSGFLYESLDGRCSFTLLEHALYFPCKRKRLFQCAALGRLCTNVVPIMVGRQLKGVIAVHLAKGVNNIHILLKMLRMIQTTLCILLVMVVSRLVDASTLACILLTH